MSARECLVCQTCGSDRCPQCGKSHLAERIIGSEIEPGKVWPSVEGEVVVEDCVAWSLSLSRGAELSDPGPGRYRVIVQKIWEEKP